jgi:hypothetical protein
MNVTTVPLKVLRLQYQLVRLPLQVIEDRVIVRLGSEAPARLVFERTLGVLDATVGQMLGDPRLAKRGSALAERSDALAWAARLDAAASQKEAHADADLQAKRDEAIEDRQQAADEKERGVEEARSKAAERKRAAADEAQKRAAAAKQEADDVAARRKDALDESKRQAQARSTAEEQKVTAAADAKLKDAQAKRNEAESKRAQADRVEALADAEKQKRQAVRASKS